MILRLTTNDLRSQKLLQAICVVTENCHSHKSLSLYLVCIKIITFCYPPPVGEGGFSRARILSGGRRHVFLWAQKLLGNFFLNFNMTFLTTWGCASDFLRMLPKFKMAARGQLQKILWAQKL